MSNGNNFLRKSFANISERDLKVPDLIQLQKESYDKFLQLNVLPERRKNKGLQSVFSEFFPIFNSSKTLKLEFVQYGISDSIYTEEEAKIKGLTYGGVISIFLRLAIFDPESDGLKVKDLREQSVCIGEMPFMTKSGTFVINGSERVVVSQVHRSPGVFLDIDNKTGRSIHSVRIIPYRGSWIDIEFDHNDIINVRIDKNKKIPLSVFLMSLSGGDTGSDSTGMSVSDIIYEFYNVSKFVKHENGVEAFLNASIYQGLKLSFDLIDFDTKEVIVPAGSKITKMKLKALENVKSYWFNKESLPDIYFAHDMKCEEGSIKASDSLVSFYDYNFAEFEGVLVDHFSQTSFLIDSIIAHPCSSRDEAMVVIYNTIRPGERPRMDVVYSLYRSLFSDPNYYTLSEVGRVKLNSRLGLDIDINKLTLTKVDILKSIKMLIELKNGKGSVDDIDSLENRRVRSVGELVENQCRIALGRFAKSIKDRFGSVDMETAMPSDFVLNSKSFTGVIKEFFCTSPLSQFMDQTNPLSEISHKRRLSSFGPGGFSKEKAWLEVRDLHPTHYGRICAVETPEGPNLGLISSLTIFSKVNEYGFISTPYYPVKNGIIQKNIEYLSSIDDKKHIIAHADRSILKEDGTFKSNLVSCRKNNEYVVVSPEEIDYIDVSPKQIISVASSLIPFIEHNDAGRALMGANMQRQAVPLIRPDTPLVGTGIEGIVVRDSGAGMVSVKPGTVMKVDASSIFVKADDGDVNTYNLRKFERTNDSTCINQTCLVDVGDSVEKGQIMADGPSMRNGELSLGKNVKVAFLSWRGGNYEDAVLISSKLANDFSSFHIEKYEISAKEIKQGLEQVTRDVPKISDEFLRHLDESGIVNIGAKVSHGDVLVGRITPKAEGNFNATERLLKALFGDKASDVIDSSLKVPPGVSGTVVDVRIFTRKGVDKNERATFIEEESIQKILEEKSEQINIIGSSYVSKLSDYSNVKISASKALKAKCKKKEIEIDSKNLVLGDILKHILNKEVSLLDLASTNVPEIENILQEYENKIKFIDKKADKEIKKIKEGDDLPAGVRVSVQVFIAVKRKLQPGDKICGRHGNKGVVSRVMNLEDMPFTKDGEPVELLFSSLGISSRMNLGQIFETHLGWAALNLGKKINKMLSGYNEGKLSISDLRNFVDKVYNKEQESKIVKSKNDEEFMDFARNLRKGVPFSSPAFDGAKDVDISNMLKLADCDPSGKEVLYDGYTGLPFQRKITVGVMHIMQLHHFVDSKIHARSVGPYSLITQQPLGGKSNFGGQRFGEMEVWALQGYGAAYIARECLTSKSDDLTTRIRVFQDISHGKEVFDSPGIPESFRVLLYQLRSLCLNVECLEKQGESLLSQRIQDIEGVDALRISLASERDILGWSSGEILEPETIHYRTLKPHKDGLFSERVFGPVTDYECKCGKYKGTKFQGLTCPSCGVLVTSSSVRRKRMGHVKLAAPVAHIWFTKALPSRMSIVLDISVKDMESILRFDSYIIIEPASSIYSYKQILSESEYHRASEETGDENFFAETGPQALELLLKNIDIENEISLITEKLNNCVKEDERKKLIRKLKIFSGFQKSNTRPEYMITRVLPVLPPDLRPLVLLDGGRFASSDINDLYRRIINRNKRLQRLIALMSPKIMIKNEMRMLQESFDALLDNSRKSRPILGANGNRVLKSLTDVLKGKDGIFRQNLLGKRVDYSGRSVIVVGPDLKLDQCGLPKEMALELFKPFVLARLVYIGFASTVRDATPMVDHKRPEVWDVLEEVIKGHPVLLNRAPTLHRLGIQAFNPILVEGKAIKLHPLVCSAFNADFDGDQMAIHIPLSIEAQLEAKVLMMSTKCLLNPSSGKIIVKPSKDMVLGIYCLTLMNEKEDKSLLISNISEAEHALERGIITYNSPFTTVVDNNGEKEKAVTTLGRMKFYEIMPKNEKIKFSMINKVFKSSDISDLVQQIYLIFDNKTNVKFLDNLMRLGFLHATLSGSSFGKDDLIIPPEKNKLVSDTKKLVEDYKTQYMEGIITEGERYNKVISAWSLFSDKIAKLVNKHMSKPDLHGVLNSVYMMMDSGARGSSTQIRQLTGGRGLLSRSDGSIQEIPITNSLKEGATSAEYVRAAQGSRKGLSDIALKTADAGYLTRRLVDVSQDCIIKGTDCGTEEGIKVECFVKGEKVSTYIREKIFGRTLARDIILEDGSILANRNDIVDDKIMESIKDRMVESIEIRSPVLCANLNSTICPKCYGYDLAELTLVQAGEASGVVAAQSIGEPGTQLTMRTFHQGGAVQSLSEETLIDSEEDSEVFFENVKFYDKKDYKIVSNRNGYVKLKGKKGVTSHKISYGAKVFVNENDKIKKGTRVAEWNPYATPFLSSIRAYVKYNDLVEGVSLKTIFDESTGAETYLVSDLSKMSKRSAMSPSIIFVDEKGSPVLKSDGNVFEHKLAVNDFIQVKDGDFVEPGDVISSRSQEVLKAQDIVGGLPRIAELFEARQPKVTAILSELDGQVRFGKDYRSKKRIIVKSKEGLESEYIVPKDRNTIVHEGDFVSKGEILVDGQVHHQDTLKILGLKSMVTNYIEDVQQVYRAQGIEINDKHIEVILRRMISHAEVEDAGDSTFLKGEYVSIRILNSVNNILIDQGKELVKFRRVLQGITKISISESSSFFAAASFQDTARVLTDAALHNSIDFLRGMKESMITGKLLPAGTGSVSRNLEDSWKNDMENSILSDMIA
ncbi:DNA-directed RNA polymerase subunit beta' [Candidatus Nesciobacter abundans]|uniref:Multifunctional fusion protein n=1 Tax=Candidatus Nesciobacter abundans TaxID=2601668 RepID=A0A5C0UGM7_9PROT|nr:DNA-directed RNA polymerase subunit beta' [Candidatus Nesciobacter abundans]QEK39228.1 DNA-directed RNA polymerase subunit beta' [Candidatus Nesciobacter abundans]